MHEAEFRGDRQHTNRVRSAIRDTFKCIGALDGTVIGTMKPLKAHGPSMLHFAHKLKSYGILFQALFNAKYEVMYCSNTTSVTAGDSSSYTLSRLHQKLEKKFAESFQDYMHYYITADAAYGQWYYIMVPFNSRKRDAYEMRVAKDAFNFHMSSMRMASEQGFGIIKARFPSLKKDLPLDLGNAAVLCSSAFMLHNFLTRWSFAMRHARVRSRHLPSLWGLKLSPGVWEEWALHRADRTFRKVSEMEPHDYEAYAGGSATDDEEIDAEDSTDAEVREIITKSVAVAAAEIKEHAATVNEYMERHARGESESDLAKELRITFSEAASHHRAQSLPKSMDHSCLKSAIVHALLIDRIERPAHE